MERICEYCKSPFTPKRTDALYCSPSCRQLAYVLRKAINNQSIEGIKDLAIEPENVNKSEFYPSTLQTEHGKESEKLTDQENKLTDQENKLTDRESEPSINNEKVDAYPLANEKLTVNTADELSVNVEIKNPSIHKTVQEKEEYAEYESVYIGELNKLIDERNIVSKLFSLFYSNVKDHALWLNIRFKCLVECLLTFSERQEIEADDLKEVCNAFTSLIESRYFKAFDLNYPYHKEIIQWRDTVKKLCIDAGQDELMILRLKKETRQTLLVIRYELANNAPKVSFSKLNFKE